MAQRDPRAGQALAIARRSAGLTQAELAVRAGTSQSAVAAYETGVRQPTLPVLDRMVRATGHVLDLDLRPDPAAVTIAEVADSVIRAQEQDRLRHVLEFVRQAGEDGHPLGLLLDDEPRPIGDPRFDALLAAVAEDLCVHADRQPPAWVHEPERFLDGAWWVSPLPSARAQALVHAPASYRRRGVMLARHDLIAA